MKYRLNSSIRIERSSCTMREHLCGSLRTSTSCILLATRAAPLGGDAYSPMEAIRTEASCCTPTYYSEHILGTFLLYNNMSGKQDDEDAVRVRPGVLEGIKGVYRIAGKVGDGEEAIVSASFSTLADTLSRSLPIAANNVQA